MNSANGGRNDYFLAVANKLIREDESADIVALIAADPECGDAMRGTGGFREVRVARGGMGKSGGARVVYIWRSEQFPVFLIMVFPNSERKTYRWRNAMPCPLVFLKLTEIENEDTI